MNEKIIERFRQLKVKFPDIESFRFEHRVEGIVLALKIAGFERPELFTGISEELLRELVYANWPSMRPQSEQGTFIIRRNGDFQGSAGSEDEAEQYLRSEAARDFEAIYSILDSNGQLIARYVSKMDGIVMRLEA